MRRSECRLFIFLFLLAASLASGQNSADQSHNQSATEELGSKQQPEPKLPDAPSASQPLTKRQKFDTFARRTYSPYTFASAAFSATWAQMWGSWYSYGGGMQGWSKRFGASLANAEGRMFFNSFLLPVVFRQDPRYFPSKKKGLIPRGWYAGTRVLVARSDAGSGMFNYSEVLGTLFLSSMQNSYYPREERGAARTFNRFVGALGSDASANALKEFSPEIKRAAKKIIPKRAQKMQKKIPEPVQQIAIPLP